MTAGPHLVLVANPTARSGRAQATIDRALELLRQAGAKAEFLPTLPGGATVEALAARLERGDVQIVVYLGGDGTFAEAAKGIMLARTRTGTDHPLAMLPMGTANDQGRSFGIVAGPNSLARNVETILNGRERQLDVGRVEVLADDGNVTHVDHWFDSFSIGLSAEILAQRNRDRARVGKVPGLRQLYSGHTVYVGAAGSTLLRALVPKAGFACQLTIDGESHSIAPCIDLIVKGTHLYAGEWILDAAAAPDDGLFECLPIGSIPKLVHMAVHNCKHNPWGVRNGRADPAETLRGEKFLLHSSRDVHAQIDGEELPSGKTFAITNLQRHIRIIVPRDAHWI